MVFGLVDLNEHVGRRIDGFEGVQFAKEMLRKENYSSFVIKRSCALQIHGLTRRSRE